MSDSPAKKAAKPKTKTKESTHPPCKAMLKAAIKNLKERKGSSYQSIKRYIEATYKVDTKLLAPFLKKAIINGVKDGMFLQVKGTGALGSFKLPPKVKSEKADKPKAAKKPKAKKPKADKEKKAKTPKKTAKAKSPAKKAAAKPKKAKTPAKKAAAKPKKAKTPKKPATKKAAKK